MIESEEIAGKVTTSMALIREAVLNKVSESRRKLTPKELEKSLARQFSTQRTTVKETIKHLVQERKLIYSYHYGCSFLEKSFNKPTLISDRVVLKPPATKYKPKTNEVVADIQPGASFGIGEHPTTRLAIRGIEHALSPSSKFNYKRDLSALDIGTGSGVLAIVTALLGAHRVLGVDIDLCAIAEAKNNVQLNNLGHRIKIHDRKVEKIDQTFDLVTANLRYPSIRRLAPHISKIIETDGAFIVSGIKTKEVPDLVAHYIQHNFQCTWQKHELGWAGLVFERTS